MKILYIITKSNWGGAQRHVHDLAIYSHNKGHEVVVALGGSGVLNDKLIAAGITTRTIGKLGRDINLGNDAASLFDISKIIRKERPDVLHLHSPKAAGLGAFAGRLWRIKKIIYTVHGWPFNEDRPVSQKMLAAFFSWLTTLFSTHVIVLSMKELGQAQAFPFILNKLRMIPLGISSPKFLAQKEAKAFIQSKTPEPLEKKIIIGTIAELHPNKGFIYSINAIEKVVAKFPSILFFIMSDGEQRAMLENLVKEKGLEKHIIFAGIVENAAQYLKGISIFILPSIKEGLPYTIIEAGYAGLPVVSTTVGGIPEIVDDMKSGILIQPKRADEIAHALEFLLEHKTVQKEYGKALQEKVTRYFSLEKMMESTMKVYEENYVPKEIMKEPVEESIVKVEPEKTIAELLETKDQQTHSL
jgi:glycosyltransferase involved in cell wall biosynthesis